MSKVKTPFKKNEYIRKIKQESKEIVYFDSIPESNFDMTYHEVTLELVKYITHLTRKTPEFRNFMIFVKSFLDINRCSFYEDYSMNNGFIIELHHYPFSLFDLCEAVAEKHLKEKSSFMTFFVIEEVVLMHYKFLVGLTPLNPTAHDLAHSEELKIHPKIVIGEWKKLYKEYFPYFGSSALKKYDELVAIEKEEETPSFPSILKLNPQKIVIKGVTPHIDYSNVNRLMINKKINEIGKITFKEG
jgi:hypothetical protein